MTLNRTASIALFLAVTASLAVAQDHHDRDSSRDRSNHSYSHSESRSSSRSSKSGRDYSRPDSSYHSYHSSSTHSWSSPSRTHSSQSSSYSSSRSNPENSHDMGLHGYSGGRSYDEGSRPSNESNRSRTWSDNNGWNWSRGDGTEGERSGIQGYHNYGGSREGQGVRSGIDGAFDRRHAPTRSYEQAARAYNFSGNRGLMREGWERDSARESLQVRAGFGFWQGPEWGGHWRYGYWAPGFGFGLGIGVGFAFGAYCFTPFEQPCYVSPWYYYPCLPAYVPTSAVTVVPGYYCPWDLGVTYRYRPAVSYESYGDPSLNQAVDEIHAVFADGKPDAIDAVLPDRGQVAIFTDGKYDYSLNSEDFHNMVADNSKITPTVSFQVLSVRRGSDGQAVVECVHEFKNEDGGADRVYQEYRLQEEEGRYHITDFMTSHTPIARSAGF